MQTDLAPVSPYMLGLDLGVSSLGWSCLAGDAERPQAVLGSGVRIFEAGVEGSIEQGKDSSRATVRREKRQPRRQIERRARRQRKVFRLLQRTGLLPDGTCVDQAQIDRIIGELDGRLRSSLVTPGDHVAAQVWPYRLRAMAMTQRLEPHALGRALYHLAQRRGFLSNRKTDKDDEESGKVKSGIAELAREMGDQTLGQYFASLDPDTVRIRQRWTAREMYTDEFEAIWAAQQPHHPDLLTPRRKRKLEQAIFKQRPLKSAKGLIGRCELEPTRRKTALASPLAQRFRLFQKVNDLLIYEPDGRQRSLAPDERSKLIEALEHQGDLTFNQARTLLGLQKSRSRTDKSTGQKITEPGHGFNLEEGGEKKIPGNRTAEKLSTVFGERWFEFAPSRQEQIIQDLLEYQNPDALAQRAVRNWALSQEQAKRLAATGLEQGYARFSRRALIRLLPRMEEGLHYMTARKDEYPDSFEARQALDLLPPVLDAIKDLRNPAVCRALTELRTVVNHIIRKHGKPEVIRLEMARDLKRPRKQREQTWKRNRDRQDERGVAAVKIKAARLVVGEPNRDTIEKWLLADECNWICPYTGKAINAESLLGPHPQFDVEHIVPFSISLDNTYLNKTLCDSHFNRHRKMNKLPAQCYDPDGQEWQATLSRVRRFRGQAASIKLERFQWAEVPDGFTQRDLQDTRYASRLAGEYLGLLYGGPVDADGRRRVQVSAGGVTAKLRDEWGLNGILNDGGFKTRDDHRHHAVDAITIALTSPATVKILSDAAANAQKAGRRRFAPIAEPWPDFLDGVHAAIGGIVVSHRVNHKVNGPLHEETNYSKSHAVKVKGKNVEARHVRKPLASLSSNEVEQIVDDRVRELVVAKLNGGDPKKVFADGSNFPAFHTRKGGLVPIKKVRIRKSVNAITIGSERSPRYVAPGSNHHMAIVATLNNAGEETKWEGHLVSRFEAMQRLRRGESIIQRDWGPQKRFMFTLSPGDTVEMFGKDKKSGYFRLLSISEKQLEFRPINDARQATVIRKIKNERITPSPSGLQKLNVQKVTVTPLGEVLPCHD